MLAVSNNFHSIVVESDSLNAISWMSCLEKGPWKFQFLFNEIKTWSSSLNIEFHHVLRSGDGMADALAKLGVEREIALLAPLEYVVLCWYLALISSQVFFLSIFFIVPFLSL